jgi:hypothetical protein
LALEAVKHWTKGTGRAGQSHLDFSHTDCRPDSQFRWHRPASQCGNLLF